MADLWMAGGRQEVTEAVAAGCAWCRHNREELPSRVMLREQPDGECIASTAVACPECGRLLSRLRTG